MVKDSAVWTLPNILTFSRIVLAFVLFGFIFSHHWVICLVIFCIATITDAVDGWIARWTNQFSALGRRLDPLADKILILGSIVCLMGLKDSALEGGSGWTLLMVAIMFAREIIVTVVRTVLEARGRAFGADTLGKIKMVLQCVAIGWVFFALAWSQSRSAPFWFTHLRDLLNWTTVLITALSGLNYLKIAFLPAPPRS